MSASPATPAAAPAAQPTKHPQFTKIDAASNALDDDAAAWFAVRVLDGSLRFDVLAGNVGDDDVDHDDAIKACAELTAGGFADWRLPTDRELSYLADRSRHRPAVDTRFFPDIKSDWYWSSSPDASDPAYAWVVNFYDGNVHLDHRDGNAFVRAVRAVPASQ